MKKILIWIFNIFCFYISIGILKGTDRFNINYYMIDTFLFFLLNIFIYFYSLYIQKKRVNAKVKYDYYRDCDFKLVSFKEAGSLISKSSFGINTIVILLYELIDMKILDRKYVNDKVYIGLHYGVNSQIINNLEITKVRIIKYIFNSSMDNNYYLLDDIINKFTNDELGKDILNETIEYYKRDINKYYDSSIKSKSSNIFKISYFFLFLPFLFSFVFLFQEIFPSVNYIRFFVIIILICLDALGIYLNNKKVIIKNEYIDEVNKLNGLYNFLNDFSNIEDKSLKYIEIYNKFYLYAISFGLTGIITNELNKRN